MPADVDVRIRLSMLAVSFGMFIVDFLSLDNKRKAFD